MSTSADTSPGTLRAVPLLAQPTSGVYPQFCRGWTDVRQSVTRFVTAGKSWHGQVFGEDLDMVGGPRLGRHIELSWELSHCGKLQALRKLLLHWHKDVTNKVSSATARTGT